MGKPMCVNTQAHPTRVTGLLKTHCKYCVAVHDQQIVVRLFCESKPELECSSHNSLKSAKLLFVSKELKDSRSGV